MRRVLPFLLILGLSFPIVHLQASPISNNASITSNSTSITFETAQTQLSVRFIARFTGAVSMVYLRPHATRRSGTSPYFSLTILDDAAGLPGSTVLAGPVTFSWQTTDWAVIPAVSSSLSAGSTYHLLIDYATGPIDPNNNRTLQVTLPNHRYNLPDQFHDPAMSVLSSTDDGANYIEQAVMPVFIVQYIGGRTQGNPFYDPLASDVSGGNNPPTQDRADDPAVGEAFTGPTADSSVNAVEVLVSRRSTLATTDDLYYALFDLSTGSALMETGPLAFAPQLVNGGPQWLRADFPANRLLSAAGQYRLYLFSPGSRQDRPPVVHGLSMAETADPYVAASFDGSTANGVESSDGGLNFLTVPNRELSYRLILSLAVPTSTPTPIIPGTSWGNLALVTSNTNGVTLNGSLMRTSIRFTAQESGRVARLHLDLQCGGGTGKYTVEVREDSIGDPKNLVGLSYPFQPVNGEQSVEFEIQPTLSAGTVYHLLFVPPAAFNASDWVKVRGTLPFTRFIPSHGVIDYNLGYIFADGSGNVWSTNAVQPVYVIEYEGGAVEGNPYSAWSVLTIHGNGTPADHSDDRIAAQAITYTGASRTFNQLEVYLTRSGDPGDLYYQILRADSGAEAIVDSGLFLPRAGFASSGWYRVNLRGPISISPGQRYQIRLYCLGGDTGNYYSWYSPQTWYPGVWTQATWGGVINRSLLFSAGPASTPNEYMDTDCPFKLNIQNSVLPIDPTFTVTRTPFAGPTFTPTSSFTPANTRTSTRTPTLTPTYTNTYSMTPTASWTATSSPSDTATVPASPTLSPTSTPTDSMTATPSLTASPSPTSTPTATPTITSTWTPTITFTMTPTSTPTRTSTFTMTPTASWTATFSPSDTATVPASPTPTATPTASNTSTTTPSPTSTPTATLTDTPVPTFTWTATSSPSDTPTVPASPTPTSTWTNTPVPTSTWTATPSPTLTPTRTPTVSGSMTATLSPTPTNILDGPVILDTNGFDPRQGPLGISLRMDSPGLVRLRVFNIAGEEVVTLLNADRPAGRHRILWDGRNAQGTVVGNGVYLVLSDMPGGLFIQKIIVLK